MKTLKEQTDQQIEKTRQNKPELMQTIDELILSAKAFREGKNAVKLGQQAADFQLIDAQGSTVSLSDLLASGPVVLTFYRGSWCPYCNLQLRALQACLPEIQDLGARLVAITPQIPDESLSQTERDALEFSVLSDLDAKVAAQYGVAWQVPERILEHMIKDRQLDLATINNGNDTILPIPATFILDSDGTVMWRYVNVDYRTRSEPSEVLRVLKLLQK